MKIIIPAKGHSYRVPAKNLQKIYDKTLLQITIEHAQQIGTAYVNSDSDEILSLAGALGAVPIRRSIELCGDKVPTMALVKEFANRFSDDYIGLMQVTTPIRDMDQIKHDLSKMIAHKYECGFSGMEWAGFAHKKYHGGGFEKAFSGDRPLTQDLQFSYIIEDGGLYVWKREALLKQTDQIFGNPFIFKTDIAVDIDTPDELRTARKYYTE